MIKFLKVAYKRGILREDIVIDIKDLKIYKDKNKKGEISIIDIRPF